MAFYVAANAPDLAPLGFVHLALLGAVVVLALALAAVERRVLRGSRWLRVSVGAVLLAETIAWYSYQASLGQMTSAHLPLELCDFTLFLVIVELFTLSPAVFDVCYYLALGGTSMALLTPDLWERFPSLATCQFFFAHGVVVAAVLYLAIAGLARPRRGSVARGLLAVNLWAVVAGSFDWVFHTNYMYLRQKPQQGSLLSLLGPWPWYIAGGEAVALVLFFLLYLPFWSGNRRLAANSR